MLKLKFHWLALLGGAAFCSGALRAQDNSALINVLIQKGILTPEEARQVGAGAARAAVKPVAVQTAAASSTTVSGKLFIDVSTVSAETAAGTKVDPSGTGLDVKRFYLGVTHQFDRVWLANLNTDSGYSSATGATSVFIKTAYVQAKLSPLAVLQAGSANMPWIPFVEDLYGFRYVENTLVDRQHFGNSADWGLHLLGSNGLISYNVAAVNGGGYKNPARGKSVDLEGRLSIEPVHGLTFAVGGYNGKLGKDSNATLVSRDATRLNALAAYATAQFKVGAEYFREKNWGYTTGAQSDKGEGCSVWTAVKLAGPWSVFARYDRDKPSQDLHPAMRDDYFNTGVQYAVSKNISLALVYKNDGVKTPASASQAAKTRELGVFAQVAF